MYTRITTTNFTIRDKAREDKESVTRGVPFDEGDVVLVIPYSVGTIIRRGDVKYFLIETDALNIREQTVKSYNYGGSTLVRFPRFREDKVIICGFDEMPYTELVVDDVEFGAVTKVDSSSVVKVHRKYMEDYHTTIVYDRKLTTIKRLDDGRFKIMSYSPSIISEYPRWRANRCVLNVPNHWIGNEVIIIRW